MYGDRAVCGICLYGVIITRRTVLCVVVGWYVVMVWDICNAEVVCGACSGSVVYGEFVGRVMWCMRLLALCGD